VLYSKTMYHVLSTTNIRLGWNCRFFKYLSYKLLFFIDVIHQTLKFWIFLVQILQILLGPLHSAKLQIHHCFKYLGQIVMDRKNFFSFIVFDSLLELTWNLEEKIFFLAILLKAHFHIHFCSAIFEMPKQISEIEDIGFFQMLSKITYFCLIL